MSIPPNSPWRGCAANFRQPASERAAQSLVETVYNFNCRVPNPPLADIEYRSSSGQEDILRPVFRWDLTPYQEVFQNGFQARRQENTTNEVYFNLDHYVHHGGRPLDSRRPATHAFVSTTLNSGWHPTVTETVEEVYRYEIYAPGGIWVVETLGDRYQYPAQDEVCFVAGIAPQYIRSAQRFRLFRDGRYTRRERLDNLIVTLNGNFNPQSHPPRMLNIRTPVFDYQNTNNTRAPLTISIWQPPAISKREELLADNSIATDWYSHGVADFESYINAAFRSSREKEAYLFMKNEYVLIDYAPVTANDKVLKGPLLICDRFPSLTGTAFAEHGIDCAFASHNGNEAFIFSGNLCALIDYAPHTKNDKIIKGPMTIRAMFPFFKGTVFESGIDAAFESTRKYEAYLFKDNQYARINYDSPGRKITSTITTVNFPSLKNTIFESGIDAAFASHKTDQAYLFKGDTYTRINFAPGTVDDYIIGGVKKILPNWPSLKPYLPCKNCGLDVHSHTSPLVNDDDRDKVIWSSHPKSIDNRWSDPSPCKSTSSVVSRRSFPIGPLCNLTCLAKTVDLRFRDTVALVLIVTLALVIFFQYMSYNQDRNEV